MERPAGSDSKRDALRATSIIGGSTAIMMVIRMVRTKVLAIYLGPAGVGLEGVFDSVVSLARTVFEFGLSGSGVRQIAAAAATGDQQRVATTVATLKIVSVALGLLGALSLFLLRDWVSLLAFGDDSHAASLGWLSLALFCGLLAGSYGALLQGLRRIGDLARVNIVGTLVSACVSIPVVIVWGLQGVAAYMITGAAVSLLAVWVYSRKIPLPVATLSWRDVTSETRGLLTLGSAFMVSAVLSSGAAFAVRALVVRDFGLAGAGEFQAATALSLVYIGFILQAMGTDFYPRLTALAEDDAAVNRLVNEQAEVSLLLALPGVLFTLALAPWVIRIFYSGSFPSAGEILLFQMCGMLLRVMSWPMGFIIMAKGRAALIVGTEVAAYGVYLVLVWFGLETLGLVGAGLAFFGLYVFHVLMVYAVVRRLTGFRWDPAYLRLAVLAALAAAGVIAARLLLEDPLATVLACAISGALGILCLRKLVRVTGVPGRLQALLRRFRVIGGP